MGAFQIVMLGRSAAEAWKPFQQYQPPFIDFRDAIKGPCNYKCSVMNRSIREQISDCLRGLEYAYKLNWYNPATFNIKEYEHYEKLENGDLNWIIPNKLLAFSTPNNSNTDHVNLTIH